MTEVLSQEEFDFSFSEDEPWVFSPNGSVFAAFPDDSLKTIADFEQYLE
jgi:hypothetical protein